MQTSTRRSFPCLGTFFFKYGLENYAEGIAFFQKHGLRCTQLASPLLQDLVNAPARAEKVARDFREAGIEVVGLAGYRNIVSPDAAKRKENLAFLKKCLALAPVFGTAFVPTETGTRHPTSDWDYTPENGSPQAWGMLVDAVGELLEEARKHGSILVIEGYVNNVLARLDQLDLLFRAFPGPQLALVLDPYNYITRDLVPTADLVCAEFLERYADRFVTAHLKDVAAFGADGTGNGPADLTGTPEFCTGVFPQQPYLRFLRDRRPDLPILIEHLSDEQLPSAIRRFHALSGHPLPLS